MDSIPPVLADAFYLLRNDLYGHLDEADWLADQERHWSVEDRTTARKLIHDLVVVIRGLMLEHKSVDSGNCQTCPSRWPCPVVTTIHDLVKDPQRQFAALVARRLEADSC